MISVFSNSFNLKNKIYLKWNDFEQNDWNFFKCKIKAIASNKRYVFVIYNYN